MFRFVFLYVCTISFVACQSARECSPEDATNKMLALGNVQSRLVAKGGESGMALAQRLAVDSAPIGEFIAQEKYREACQKADEIIKSLGINIEGELKEIVTVEQLAKDGGKGGGSCSIADASIKQMEIHKKLQALVDSGARDVSVFNDFNNDTKEFASLLGTNPSKACELLEKVTEKYGIQ